MTVVNQTKNRDKEFVVTKEEMAQRAAADATWPSLLGLRGHDTAVGVPNLVDRETLDREFLGDNDNLIIAVYSTPKAAAESGLACLKHALPVPSSAFNV